MKNLNRLRLGFTLIALVSFTMLLANSASSQNDASASQSGNIVHVQSGKVIFKDLNGKTLRTQLVNGAYQSENEVLKKLKSPVL